jgi:hypothetical protein
MALVLVVLAFAAVAALAPVLGKDTSDARSENAHPDQGWYPAA